jgi:hypothetical protein
MERSNRCQWREIVAGRSPQLTSPRETLKGLKAGRSCAMSQLSQRRRSKRDLRDWRQPLRDKPLVPRDQRGRLRRCFVASVKQARTPSPSLRFLQRLETSNRLELT